MADFEMCIVGAGAAAMYYLDARMGSALTGSLQQQLEKRFEKDRGRFALERASLADTVLIGADNPWHIRKEDRYTGRGSGYFVNHTRQIISTRALPVSDDSLTRQETEDSWRGVFDGREEVDDADVLFGQSQGYTRREDFAEEWLEVIGRATSQGLTRLWAYVTRISPPTKEKNHFEIEFEQRGAGGRSLTAERVLVLMGGGGWTKPAGLPQSDRILDLDQYMRLLAAQAQGEIGGHHHVCIQGANAAIDGIEQAIRLDNSVTWLARSAPRILGRSLLAHAPALSRCIGRGAQHGEYQPPKRARKSFLYTGIQRTLVEPREGGLTVWATRKALADGDVEDTFPKDIEIKPDYYVYCIGQDASASSVGVSALLQKTNIVSDPPADSDWEPYWDEGWQFRQLSQRSNAVREAAIGLRKKFPKNPPDASSHCELHLFGAAAFMLLTPGSELAKQLQLVTNFQVGSVADVRQLGAIRDVMRAYCHALSGASLDPVNVNFLGASKDELAAFIAMHCGNVPAIVADDLVQFLLMVRTRPEYTNGFTGGERQAIYASLLAVDDLFESATREVQDFFAKSLWQLRDAMLAPFRAAERKKDLQWDDVTQDFLKLGRSL